MRALAVAWFSVAASEVPQCRVIYLTTTGAVAMIAASIKPTALLLCALPVLTIGWPRGPRLTAVAAGAG